MTDPSPQTTPTTARDKPKGVTSVAWFPKSAPRAHGGVAGTLVRTAVGAAAGGVLFKLGHTTLAYIAWSITGLAGAVSLASPRARDALARGLAWFGQMVGRVVGSVLLTTVFFLVLTPVRLVKWLSGHDDLRLLPERLPSYYEPCDPAERKLRYAHTMFATEVQRPKRGKLVAALVAAVVLLGLAEGLLRSQGFGPDAVVYVLDPLAGYYPAPNQRHDRYGGRVHVNNLGMRAPDFTEEKAEGVFRVMMIGDSTLWGGSYVDQDELYARIVDRKLNALGEGKVEVLNIGVNGWGPFHERGYIELYGQLGADLVIIAMPDDDIERDRYSLMSLPFFRQGKAPRLALEEVAMHAMWRFRRDRVGYSDEWVEVQREYGLREYERLIKYLMTGDPGGPPSVRPSRTKVGGAEVMVHILPSQPAGFGERPDDWEVRNVADIKARLGALGIEVFYPEGLFKGKGTPDEMYHDLDHLNPKGHAIYADFVHDTIVKSGRFRAWRAAHSAQRMP